MRSTTRLALRLMGLACIVAGIALLVGCVSDGNGGVRLFGVTTDASGHKKFSTTQAAADTQDPQLRAQSSLLGPFGPIGLELAGVALYGISHLNKRVDSNTLKHAITAAAPQIVDGLVKAIPDDPPAPAAAAASASASPQAPPKTS